MPQVDLETLVSACAGGSCADRKIACETLAADNQNHNQNQNLNPEDDDGEESGGDYDQPEVPPDYPPESFWLSKDAELDWFDRNAFFERRDSSKGANSNSTNLNPNLNPSTNSSSQRYSHNHIKSKASSIIGLPKSQKSCFVDCKNRRTSKPANTHLFPKRSGSVAKSDASAYEPSSPKVSCMGRVRSKRDRNRRLRNRQQRASEPEPEKPKPAGRRKTGLLASFRAIFRTGCKENRASEVHAPQGNTSAKNLDVHDIMNRLPPGDVDAPPRKSVTAVEPPGLGGMQRFASGRRSGSWGVGELDGELARDDSSDRDTVWRR